MKKIGAIVAGLAIFACSVVVGGIGWFILEFSCFKTCSSPHPNILLGRWFLALSIVLGIQFGYIVYRQTFGQPVKRMGKIFLVTGILFALALIPVFTIYPIQQKTRKDQRIQALEKLPFGVYVGKGADNRVMVNPVQTDTTPAMYSVSLSVPKGYMDIAGGNYSAYKEDLGTPPCNMRVLANYLSPGSLIRKTPYYRDESQFKRCQFYPESGMYVVAGKDYGREVFYTSYVRDNTLLIIRGEYDGGTVVTTFLGDVDEYIKSLQLKTPQELVQ